MSFAAASNAQFIDDQYALWKRDPDAVSSDWQAFFQGFTLAAEGPPAAATDRSACVLEAKAEALIHRYRDLGHLMACLDPLSVCPTSHPLLDLTAVGLAEADLDRTVYAPGFTADEFVPLREVLAVLRETYCGSVGVEYMHLQDPGEREWLRERMEPARNRGEFTPEEKRRILDQILKAGRFEEFLQKRYLGQTRFSLEGAEAILPLLQALVESGARAGVEEVILGMAHRGRLNLQANLLGKSYEEVFCEFEASYDPEAVPGGGDVKYHDGYVGQVDAGAGRTVRVILPENPSHLEAVNPVVEGLARALQDRRGEDGPTKVLPVLVHGDAAFPGQGIVAETLNLSRLEGYATGGTVHLVLNNQIGYTTLPEHARSTRYATDVAKMLMVPIFHVHGEDPEAVIFVTRLALEYRMEFGKDAVVDAVCYRRHGHNEGDEPYFTQPLLYRMIRERPPLYQLYARQLAEEGALAEGDLERLGAAIDQDLESAFQTARSKHCVWVPPRRWEGWEDLDTRYTTGPVDTAVDAERIGSLARALLRVPEGFSLNTTLSRVFQRRLENLEQEGKVDWPLAEALAFGALLVEGISVRLSGEDSRRGTFSQRHCVWFDTETGETRVPLAHLAPDQARFRAYDSPLSEAGVLGFEYGYSLADPRSLVVWEAQYGDFSNGAQVIVDQFVASGEAKWQRPSGLVLLLPHGYEGQGPDHSTSRVERYLQLCAEENLEVCQPTTPAQYFHLLRRQVKRRFRKPLVVLTPKSLLRHPEVVSKLSDLAGGGFREVLDDPEPPRKPVHRAILCSGKLYYDLLSRRRSDGVQGVALIRVEQLYPFPEERLAEVAERYPKVSAWCWAQEEPRNMGAWGFVAPRLEGLLGTPIAYAGRPEAASPATGFSFIHRQEQESLVAQALSAAAQEAPPTPKRRESGREGRGRQTGQKARR